MADYTEDYSLKISVKDENVKAQLAEIDAAIKKLEKNKINIRVGVADSKAKDDLSAVMLLAEKLDTMKVGIHVSVTGDKQVVAQLSNIQKLNAQNSKERIAQLNAEQRATAQAANLEERRANNAAKLAQRQPIIDRQVSKLDLQQEGQSIRNMSSMLTLQKKLAAQGNVFTNLGKGLSSISTQLSTISNMANTTSTALQKVATPLLTIGGAGALGVGVGIASQISGALKYGQTVENSQKSLEAQGISAEKVADLYKNEIIPYANATPFDVANMTQAVSLMNAYVGNMDKSVRATKVFGTALYASGKTAQDLDPVTVNLGQLYSGSFNKADYTQLIKGVPTMMAALRDKGINSWEDFNKALGDDPATKTIERTGNALDLVTDAMDQFNIKTDALAKSNSSVSAKLENSQGAYQTLRDNVLKNSGAYAAFGKVLDSLGDKLQSKEMEQALTKMFAGALPWLDKLSVAIDKFDISKFVSGIESGYARVKKTLSDIVSNPIAKSGTNLVSSMFGLNGGPESIGDIIGKMLSAGIKLGLGSVSFKGLALGTRGLSGAFSIAGTLATVVGKSIKNSSAKKEVASVVQKFMSNSVKEGAQAAVSAGANTAEKSAAATISKGIGSKIGATLAGIGGGLTGLGIGMTSTGIGTMVMAKGVRDVVDTVKKVVDAVPDDLPDVQAMSTKITTFAKWGNQLASINLAGNFSRAITNVNTTLVTIGGAMMGVGAVTGFAPAVIGGALLSAGSFLSTALQTLSEFNTKLKLENINRLADLPSKIAKIPDLSSVDIKDKLHSITVAVDGLYNELNTKQNGTVRTNANGAQVSFASSLSSKMSQINDALPASITGELAKTFTNLKTFGSAIEKLGDIKSVGNKAKEGMHNVYNAITSLTSDVGTGGLFDKGSDTKSLSNFEKFVNKFNPGQFSTFNNNSTSLPAALKTLQKQIAPFSDGSIDVSALSKSMTGLTNFSNEMSKLPNLGNQNDVTTKMSTLGQAVRTITAAFNERSFGVSYKMVDPKAMTSMMESVTTLMPIMRQMSDLKLNDKNTTSGIESVGKAINTFKNAFSSVNSGSTKASSVKLIDSASMAAMLDSVTKLLPLIDSLKNIDLGDKTNAKIASVGKAISTIKTSFEASTNNIGNPKKMLDPSSISGMMDSVGKLLPLINSLKDITIDDKINAKIAAVGKAISTIKTSFEASTNSKGSAKKMIDVGSMSSMLDSVAKLLPLINSLKDITIDDSINSKIASVGKAIDTIKSSFEANTTKGVAKKMIDPGNMSSMIDSVNKLLPFINSLKDINIDDSVNAKITSLSKTINTIKSAFEASTNAKGAAKPMIDPSMMSSMISTVSALIPLIKAANDLGDVKPGSGIESIGKAITTIRNAFEASTDSKGSAKKMIDPSTMSGMLSAVSSMIPIIQAANDLGEVKSGGGIDNVIKAVTTIRNAFEASTDGKGAAKAMIDPATMGGMLSTISSMIPIIREANDLGQAKDNGGIDNVAISLRKIIAAFNLGDMKLVGADQMSGLLGSVDSAIGVIQRINSANISADTIAKVDIMQQVINKLKALATGYSPLGAGAVPNFVDTVNQMTQLDSTLSSIAARAGSINTLTSSMADLFGRVNTVKTSVDKLKGAIAALPSSKTITITVSDHATSVLNNIVSLLNSVRSKTVTVTTNKVTNEDKKAVGGVIGKFADGGLVSSLFKNQTRSLKFGQDTVHAMLSQGEAVIRRSAVARVGKGFIDSLNKGHLQSAYNELSSRVATNYSRNIANNQTYTNAPQINQHFYGSAQQSNSFIRQQLKGI